MRGIWHNKKGRKPNGFYVLVESSSIKKNKVKGGYSKVKEMLKLRVWKRFSQ